MQYGRIINFKNNNVMSTQQQPSQAPSQKEIWEKHCTEIVVKYLPGKEEVREAKHSIASAMIFALDSDMAKLGIDPEISAWLSNLYNMLHRLERAY
jgi:hypothetical protein